MKKFLFFLTTLFVLSTYAQQTSSTQLDERYAAIYTQDEIETIESENIDDIVFMNYYVENGFVVKNLPQEKYDAQDFPVIQINKKEIVNILALEGFDFFLGEREYLKYKIENTTSILIVLSTIKVQKDFVKLNAQN